ncbi:Autocrine proliferation repressor protein A (PhoPQ-activated pathogenicity-related protein), partial [Durusdinium trenchii]
MAATCWWPLSLLAACSIVNWWLLPLVAACPDCPENVQLLQQSLRLKKAPISSTLPSFLKHCTGWDCLQQYVRSRDDAFTWRQANHSLQGGDWTGTVLEMTSQRWLPQLVSPDVWNHTLVVITPQNVSKDLCLLYIALGYFGSPLVPSSHVASSNEDVQAAAKMALAAGTHAAVLFNVPAEYLTPPQLDFPHPLVEDQMLSASWALFRDRGLSQTPLELPMTKAAVKAMDVIGEFLDVHSFVLVGASKRGNLCWHTATVDARVRGIVPIARAINLGAVLARTQRQLGGFPMVTQDYVEKHLLAGYLETPSGEPLLHIEEPWMQT